MSNRDCSGYFIFQIKLKFPDNDLVKIYTGQKVPWGDDGLRPDDDQAPQWAVDQVELRRRADYVGEWWFTQRQQKNGELPENEEKPLPENSIWDD